MVVLGDVVRMLIFSRGVSIAEWDSVRSGSIDQVVCNIVKQKCAFWLLLDKLLPYIMQFGVFCNVSVFKTKARIIA